MFEQIAGVHYESPRGHALRGGNAQLGLSSDTWRAVISAGWKKELEDERSGTAHDAPT